jgi:hypothetical protein
LAGETFGQKPLEKTTQRGPPGKLAWIGQHATQPAPRESVAPSPIGRLQRFPANLQQLTELDPGWASRLARATRQTAIQMRLRSCCLLSTAGLEQLLDEVDPAARTIELVAKHLVGWAGRVAEATMHAAAQDGVGALTFWGLT